MCLAAASLVGGLGSPVFAQRYPPFPIGGGSGATGGTTSPQGSGSSEFFNPGRSAGGSNADGAGSNRDRDANDDGGPACDHTHCLRYAGQVGNAFIAGRVEELRNLRVAAISGCCEAGARVDVYVESDRVFLGTVRANDDGSYFGEFTLPASIKQGRHTLIADIEGCGEFRGALEVLGEGASVLGTSTRNTSGAGGGILPRTGGDFLKILLWALILIAFGAALIVLTRRFAPARAGVPGARRDIPALPPPEVPFVDTSRFVPYRSAPGERQASRRGRTAPVWDRAQKNAPPR